MKIGVIGAGYVGLTTGACLAEIGNEVVVVDADEGKIRTLSDGLSPHYEPGLEEIIARNRRADRLRFSCRPEEAVLGREAVFLAVGTPRNEDGSADLSQLRQAAREVAAAMDGYRLIVIKSTAPPGSNRMLEELMASFTPFEFDVVSNPEFLKEGMAVEDFMKPDRVVAGMRTERAREGVRRIYHAFFRLGRRLLETDPESAEMIKYASNALLAARISLMNELALICAHAGADAEVVRVGVGLDKRLGPAFLYPGLGYGGSCFPKDIRALISYAEAAGLKADICRAVDEVNSRQVDLMAGLIAEEFGPDWSGLTFALWGLAFKPRTDDVRQSPALRLAEIMLKRGATVRGFDPEAAANAQKSLPGLKLAAKRYEALDGADALLLCTEWSEFRTPDWPEVARRLARRVLFDGRNIYDPEILRELGFVYYSIGRRPVRPDSRAIF